MLVAIGAAVAVLTGLGAGLGISLATGKAVDAVARQPEAQSDILKIMLVGQGVSETPIIFAFVVSIILMFANPLVGLLEGRLLKL